MWKEINQTEVFVEKNQHHPPPRNDSSESVEIILYFALNVCPAAVRHEMLSSAKEWGFPSVPKQDLFGR